MTNHSMRKSQQRFLGLMLLLVFSASLSAQTVGSVSSPAPDLHTLKLMFLGSIPLSDMSLRFLMTIFGQFTIAGGVDATSTTVSVLIKYFNFGLLFFIGGMLAYTTSMHVIKTANQGAMMGKKSGASTTVFRMATSVSLVVPLPLYGGYCALQLFVLNVVLQGIGIADFAWNKVVHLYNTTGSVLPQALQEDVNQHAMEDLVRQNKANLFKISQNVMDSQLCLWVNYDIYTQKTSSFARRPLKDLISYTNPTKNKSGKISYPEFQGDAYLQCPDVQFSGQLQDEANYTSKITDDIVQNRFESFKTYYQGLLDVTKAIYQQAQKVDSGQALSWQCKVYNQGNTPISGAQCEQYPTVYQLASQFSENIHQQNQQNFNIFYPSDASNATNRPMIDPSSGWLSAGMLYHKLLGTTRTLGSGIVAKQRTYLSMKQDKPMGFQVDAFDSGKMMDVDSLSKVSSEQIDAVTYAYSYIHQGYMSHCPENPAGQCEGFNLLYDAMVASANQDQNQNSLVANKSILQQLKQNLWRAAYNIMPKKDLGPENYQKNKSSIQQNERNIGNRNYGLLHTMYCAGMPVVSWFDKKGDCQSRSSQSMFGFGAFMAIKNIGNPAKELQDSGYYGSINSRSEFISKDIQFLILDLFDSWFQLIAQHIQTNDVIQYDPLANLRNYGIAIISASYNFLTRVVQDTWLTNYSALLIALSEQLKYGVASMMTYGATIGINWAGDALINTAEFDFGIGLILGYILKVASIVPNTFSAYFQGLQGSYALFYPLVLASRTLYTAISVAITLPIMGLGIMFATYVPMIPFIVFIFTGIGWLMTVIEAVLAAPIVAAGVASPQGHDFLGKAQQIGMMLVSVMIRPICILIGFMMSIFVFIGAVKLLNTLFVYFFNSMLYYNVIAPNISASTAPPEVSTGFYVSLLLMMFAYGLLIYALVDFVFSLTFILPTFVVRWIGLRPITGGEEKAIMGIEGGMRDQLIGQGLSGVTNTALAQKQGINSV